MKKYYLVITFFLLSLNLSDFSRSSPDPASMQSLKASLGNPKNLNWTDPNPCKWKYVKCSSDNRVTHIRIKGKNLTGSLPLDLKNLSSLILLDVSQNFLTGPVPSLAGLSFLQEVLLNNNFFSSIPAEFFSGLTSLRSIKLDYIPFSSWEIPESLKYCKELRTFSANVANISGTIPDFLGRDPPKLRHLYLSTNYLEGPIPLSFGKTSIQTLWLGSQGVRGGPQLNGSLTVLQNLTSITDVFLSANNFTGPLPDFSRLTRLEILRLGGNQLTGIIPSSLINLPKLKYISLVHNFFQGPAPKFNESKVDVDKDPRGRAPNSFCLDDPGVACDSRVNILLSIAKSMSYPLVFAKNWTGNDPCKTWNGILCNKEGSITFVNFRNLQLQGKISPDFSMLRSVEQLILSNNLLTGTIPNELTSLPNLTMLDLSNNNLHGKVPKFGQNVTINIDGNPGIEKDGSFPFPGESQDSGKGRISSGGGGKKSNPGIVLGSAFAGAVFGLFIVVIGFCFYNKKRNNALNIHKLKAVVINPKDASTRGVPVNGFGNMVISFHVLREVTNNFSVQNILGRGGFGTVYKGKLPDGMKIAVKRMEVEILRDRRLKQFKSEIAVLTKVRHRHLVALLGYCLDENERLLVYELMPQGTLSRHLFNWKEEGLKPLDWSRRLIIALDVARGVEYLHGLAHESFIHRDLKPSNILLGDDMRAKVADFGLVRLAPENGTHSTETRIAGTFGYLAPEYVVTGRVTTKVDVFTFGVVLMELITGRKVVDETQSDPENVYLVTWFRSMLVNQDTFGIAIDETIELDEETLASVSAVAELADHCCASQPYQRPDMGRVVNVLSSLAELQKPIRSQFDL